MTQLKNSYKMPYMRIVLILTLLIFPALVQAENLPVSISIHSNGEQIKLQLPTSQRAKLFTLTAPDRLVIDALHRGAHPTVHLPSDYGGQLIKGIRSGKYNAQTTRLVLELTAPVNYQSRQQGKHLTLQLIATGQAPTAPTPIVKLPVKNQKKTIVIDAGHGGQDPGALGKAGLKEKRIVLAYAKALKDRLDATGRYRTVLTRDGDYYIALRERIAFARKSGGDLFISLHADSGSTKARGLSIYTLSENASDEEAAMLAERENQSDVIAGIDLGTHDADVANILISLAQRETNHASAQLADVLVGTMLDKDVTLLNNPHRQAGFAVLKAPDIPSALVELGFLSNPGEAIRLNDKQHRGKIVKALQLGIDRYFKKERP